MDERGLARRGSGALQPQPPQPASSAGSGSPIASSSRSQNSHASSAGSPLAAAQPVASPRDRARGCGRARLPSAPPSARARVAYSSRRRIRGATEVPPTCSIRNPAVPKRPPAGSNATGRGTVTPAGGRELDDRVLDRERDPRLTARRVAAQHPARRRRLDQPRLARRAALDRAQPRARPASTPSSSAIPSGFGPQSPRRSSP